MKKEEIVEKLKKGDKLIKMKSFVNPRASFTSKIKRGAEYIWYQFEDGTKITKTQGQSLEKSGMVTVESSVRTMGGTKYILKPAPFFFS
jgi:hypothetical protein